MATAETIAVSPRPHMQEEEDASSSHRLPLGSTALPPSSGPPETPPAITERRVNKALPSPPPSPIRLDIDTSSPAAGTDERASHDHALDDGQSNDVCGGADEDLDSVLNEFQHGDAATATSSSSSSSSSSATASSSSRLSASLPQPSANRASVASSVSSSSGSSQYSELIGELRARRATRTLPEQQPDEPPSSAVSEKRSTWTSSVAGYIWRLGGWNPSAHNHQPQKTPHAASTASVALSEKHPVIEDPVSYRDVVNSGEYDGDLAEFDGSIVAQDSNVTFLDKRMASNCSKAKGPARRVKSSDRGNSPIREDDQQAGVAASGGGLFSWVKSLLVASKKTSEETPKNERPLFGSIKRRPRIKKKRRPLESSHSTTVPTSTTSDSWLSRTWNNLFARNSRSNSQEQGNEGLSTATPPVVLQPPSPQSSASSLERTGYDGDSEKSATLHHRSRIGNSGTGTRQMRSESSLSTHQQHNTLESRLAASTLTNIRPADCSVCGGTQFKADGMVCQPCSSTNTIIPVDDAEVSKENTVSLAPEKKKGLRFPRRLFKRRPVDGATGDHAAQYASSLSASADPRKSVDPSRKSIEPRKSTASSIQRRQQQSEVKRKIVSLLTRHNSISPASKSVVDPPMESPKLSPIESPKLSSPVSVRRRRNSTLPPIPTPSKSIVVVVPPHQQRPSHAQKVSSLDPGPQSDWIIELRTLSQQLNDLSSHSAEEDLRSWSTNLMSGTTSWDTPDEAQEEDGDLVLSDSLRKLYNDVIGLKSNDKFGFDEVVERCWFDASFPGVQNEVWDDGDVVEEWYVDDDVPLEVYRQSLML